MTSNPEAMGWDSWWFWKKAVSWNLRLDEASWFFDLGEASPVMDYRMPARCWVRWNSQRSRNCVCLSLPVSKNLKVKKVIKVSYLNYGESSVFRVFRDSYACERSPHPYIRIFYKPTFEYVTMSVDWYSIKNKNKLHG